MFAKSNYLNELIKMCNSFQSFQRVEKFFDTIGVDRWTWLLAITEIVPQIWLILYISSKSFTTFADFMNIFFQLGIMMPTKQVLESWNVISNRNVCSEHVLWMFEWYHLLDRQKWFHCSKTSADREHPVEFKTTDSQSNHTNKRIRNRKN